MKDDIEKLLVKADINEVLAEVTKIADEINELIVIYTKLDQIYWQNNGIILSRSVFLLESVKYAILKGEE